MKTILKALLIVMLIITVGLVGAAIGSGGDTAMIGLNLLWGYFLVVLAVAAALFCAIFGMIQAPAGLKSSIISLVLVVAVLGLAYQLSVSNPKEIVNIGDGGFFGKDETILTEMSIIVGYVAFIGAAAVSLLSELMGVYRSLVK